MEKKVLVLLIVVLIIIIFLLGILLITQPLGGTAWNFIATAALVIAMIYNMLRIIIIIIPYFPKIKRETEKISRFITDRINRHRRLRVFLCCRDKDYVNIRAISSKLISKGIDTHINAKRNLPEERQIKKIQNWFDWADVILICVSSRSVDDPDSSDQEIQFPVRIAQQNGNWETKIYVLRLGDCKIPPEIDKYPQIENVDKEYENLSEKLIEWKNKQISDRRLSWKGIGISLGVAILALIILLSDGKGRFPPVNPPKVTPLENLPVAVTSVAVSATPTVIRPFTLPPVPTLEAAPNPLPGWKKYESPGSYLAISPVTIADRSDHELIAEVSKLKYGPIQSKGYCGVIIDYKENPIDLSKYNAISFLVIGQQGREMFLVKIKDESKHEFQSIQTAGISWQKIVISFSNFDNNDLTDPQKFDLTRVENLSVNFKEELGKNGTIYLTPFQFE